MPIGYIFWLIWILWVVFSLFTIGFGAGGVAWQPVVLFVFEAILFALLGAKTFGKLVQG